MNDLAGIVARDATWEPRCQFIKANEQTAKGYGQWGGQHPWPMTVAQADGHYLLCGAKERDLPHRFAGPEWNHDEFVYDPAQDTDPRSTIRYLLTLLDEQKAPADATTS